MTKSKTTTLKVFKAILINPTKKTISEVGIHDKYEEWLTLIGASSLDRVRINHKNYVWVDDEGLLRDPQHFFKGTFYPKPLAGNALIIGGGGETVKDTTITLEQVIAMISFPNVEFTGFNTSMAELGEVTVFRREAQFKGSYDKTN